MSTEALSWQNEQAHLAHRKGTTGGRAVRAAHCVSCAQLWECPLGSAAGVGGLKQNLLERSAHEPIRPQV